MPCSSAFLLRLQRTGTAALGGLPLFFQALAGFVCSRCALRHLLCQVCRTLLLAFLRLLRTLLRLVGALLLQHIGRSVGTAHPVRAVQARQRRGLLALGQLAPAQCCPFAPLGFVEGHLLLRQRNGRLACATAFTVQAVLHRKALVAHRFGLLQRGVNGLALLIKPCALLRPCRINIGLR